VRKKSSMDENYFIGFSIVVLNRVHLAYRMVNAQGVGHLHVGYLLCLINASHTLV
jgi:hypothetical protein